MRTSGAALMWLLCTLTLAVAVPVAWTQLHIIDSAGYAGLARKAATNPELESAMAGELTGQVMRMGYGADPAAVSGIAGAYTASPAFPAQFARANGFLHQWLFTGAAADDQGRWVIDLAPMLSDPAFAPALRDYAITVPPSLPVALADDAVGRPGPAVLQLAGRWGPWVSAGTAALAGLFALCMLLLSNNRGKALAALGVSALLVGAGGWAAIAATRGRVAAALDGTPENLRRIAEVMADTARASMHQWLNVSLVVGAGLVVVGVIVATLSGLARSGRPASAAGTRSRARP